MRGIKATALSVSIPAPVGGWNARDSIANMNPLDAVILENWFPLTSDVICRKGYSQHTTGISGQVESLLSYYGPTTSKFFAVAGTALYDVTSAGAVGAASLSGLTNARWQSINVSTAGGNYLQMVNGADKMRTFDGTNWHADGDGPPYDVTGVNTQNCIQINLFKNRVWLVQKDSLKAWYLPTDSIGGAANSVNLSSVANEGGYLMAMATWTIDAGYGVDDMLAFLTSRGEVIVYRGTDPSSSSTYQLAGVWKIGAPVGRRCFIKYAGDVLVICEDGVFPLSTALQSDRLDTRAALTDKIQYAVNQAVNLYGANYGWQIETFPAQNMLLLNVPVQEGDMQQQYVMNTITKAWCPFTGWHANCFSSFADDLYFGGDGFVGKAWDTLADNGVAISANALQAFTYVGESGKLKRFTMMRPILQTNGSPSTLAALNVDFDTSDPTSPLSFTPITYGVWDTGVWDTAVWGSDLVIAKAWQGATGVGYAVAPRLKLQQSGIETHWIATDVVGEAGAIL